ncbi:GNAT family N-acetyltransferase [Bacillus siamensis]|uniref:N-acetyltransferase n=1 Tax=Bacillus siamensis TaxID=659243 RepID=A0AAI8HLR6_9BACI|nr:N-acetyltransferase [Bacillus siamensis]
MYVFSSFFIEKTGGDQVKPVIRAMKASDIKQVRQIAERSWHHTYEGIIPRHIQDQFLESAYHDEMMERRLRHSLFLVAEEKEGRHLGFANATPVQKDGKAELAAIYIDPDCQGSGIGTALLKECIRQSGGIKELYVHAEKENRPALSFYQAKGFQWVCEFEEDFKGHTLQTVKLVLNI